MTTIFFWGVIYYKILFLTSDMGVVSNPINASIADEMSTSALAKLFSMRKISNYLQKLSKFTLVLFELSRYPDIFAVTPLFLRGTLLSIGRFIEVSRNNSSNNEIFWLATNTSLSLWAKYTFETMNQMYYVLSRELC